MADYLGESTEYNVEEDRSYEWRNWIMLQLLHGMKGYGKQNQHVLSFVLHTLMEQMREL